MKWFIVRGTGRLCIVQDVNSSEAQKRFLLRFPECRERVWVNEIKHNPGGQILEIANEDTGEDKLWLVRGQNHPDCFFKAKTERQARELFLDGAITEFPSTSYTEISLTTLLQLCPVGFMINDDVSF